MPVGLFVMSAGVAHPPMGKDLNAISVLPASMTSVRNAQLQNNWYPLPRSPSLSNGALLWLCNCRAYLRRSNCVDRVRIMHMGCSYIEIYCLLYREMLMSAYSSAEFIPLFFLYTHNTHTHTHALTYGLVVLHYMRPLS